MAEIMPDSLTQPECEARSLAKADSVTKPEDEASSSARAESVTKPEDKASSSARADSVTKPEDKASSSARADSVTKPEDKASSSAREDMEKTLSRNILECLRTLMQLDPSLEERLVGFGDPGEVVEPSKTIPPAILSEYRRALDDRYFFPVDLVLYLMEMADDYPQLLMEVSPDLHRTFLHISVIANSEAQVQRLLDVMLADAANKKDDMSKHLRYLLTVEKRSGLTAYQMAGIVGNDQITRVIKSCQIQFGDSGSSIPAPNHVVGPEDHRAKTSQCLTEAELQQREAIGRILKSCLEPLGLPEEPLKLMSLGDEFRLHISLAVSLCESSCNCWFEYDEDHVEEFLRGIVSKLDEEELLSTFLELRDNAGRHILHYLADLPQGWTVTGDEYVVFDRVFTTLMYALKPHVNDMNVKDFVGRTPLHLASVQGFSRRVELFVNDANTDLNATFSMSTFGVDRAGAVDRDVTDISALILAAMHNHFKVIEILLNSPTSRLNVDSEIVIEERWKESNYKQNYLRGRTPLQLAARRGHVETLNILLADARVQDFGSNSLPKIVEHKHTAPALHLAALGSKPNAVKALLKSDKINIFSTDRYGQTALGYALDQSEYEDVFGPWEVANVIHCMEIFSNRGPKLKNSAEIIGCIDLLLQAGLEIDHVDEDGESSCISPLTPQDVQLWWYNKVAQELQVTKKNVSDATNAISVTAALVAATSFVGPLQPPLGMSTNTDAENMWLLGYSQVNHPAVAIFLLFDSLSFYLAMASIMLALVPSLPIQREGNFLGVKNAQRCLQGAVVLLAASITFLICTFSAASVVIIPQGRWKYQSIIVFAILFGGSICLIALFLFLKRLWRLFRPKKSLWRKKVFWPF